MSDIEFEIRENDKRKFCKSESYNYAFDKTSGLFMRWGKTEDDDPEISPFGCEIADIEISTICSKGCKACSPKGTLINMINGSKKDISKIKVGDEIFGYNLNTQTKTKQIVKELYNREYNGDLIIIKSGKNILKLTPEHDVYTKNRKWVNASDLNKNDILINIHENTK